MNPLAQRRMQDLAKVTRLAARSRGCIAVCETVDSPPSQITLSLGYKTAPTARYPAEVRESTRIRITFGARYPFQEPAVDILDPIYNPNVYPSGRVCLGNKWLATEGLDLIVLRVAKILTYDPETVNDSNPANMEAAMWFKSVALQHPQAFPTQKIEIDPDVAAKAIRWNEK
ncbi:MAG: ubiquitin-conjugating enzyme E2 [Rhodospirillaceae bacterium]